MGTAVSLVSLPDALRLILQDLVKIGSPGGYQPLEHENDPTFAQQLRDFHLPPRPDPQRTPLAYRNWRSALGPPLSFFKEVDIAKAFSILPAAIAGAPRPNHGRSTQESSRNWSGAVVRQPTGKKIVGAQGRWRVPKPLPPHRDTGHLCDTYQSSAWIGMDGHDAASRFLPQIGSAQILTRMTSTSPSAPHIPSILLWWQLCIRRAETQAIFLTDFPLTFGQFVYAQVSPIPGGVNLLFRNDSNHEPNSDFPNVFAMDLLVPCEGRTAEWIVERPADLPAETDLRFFSLPAYGHVEFRDCNAVCEDAGGQSEIQLKKARYIRLNAWDRAGRPCVLPRGTLVSAPDLNASGDDFLTVRYVDA